MKDGVSAEEAAKQEAAQKAKADKAAAEKAAKEKAAAESKAQKEKEAAEKKAAAEKEKAEKAAAKNVEKYDPNIKEHTSTLANKLTELFGETWKADKEAAKKFSRETMAGKDFRDQKTGQILESFIAECNAAFGSADAAL